MKKSTALVPGAEVAGEILRCAKKGNEIYIKYKNWASLKDDGDYEDHSRRILDRKGAGQIIILKNMDDRYSIATYVLDNSKGNLELGYPGKGYVRTLYLHIKENERDDVMLREISKIIKTTDYPVAVINAMLGYVKEYEVRKSSKFNNKPKRY